MPLLRADAFFSHSSAALILGLPLPEALARDALVHVSVPEPGSRPQRAGVVGHEVRVEDGDIQNWHGLPVTSPVRTFVHLSTQLTLPHLVAVGDYLVAHPTPYANPAELQKAARDHRGRRGARVLGRAVDLVRVGAESPMESILRVLLVEHGLPEPELNASLFEAGGRFLARVDLLYRDQRLVIEFEGDQHRTDRRQFVRDLDRIDDLIRDDWRVLRFSSRHVFLTPRSTVARVEDALRERGWSGRP